MLFYLFAFISEVVGTTAGFGSSTLFLPLALFFFDFKTSLVLVAFFHLFGNISRVGFFRRSLDANLTLRFGIPSILMTLIGASIAGQLTQNLFKGILGIFLIVYSLLSIRKEKLHLKKNLPNIVLGGSISGFLAGLIGTGGALRGAFLLAFNLSKEKYIATAATVALIVDLTRIPVYLNHGFLQNQSLWSIVFLFPTALAGSFVGRKIVGVLPQKQFRRLVLIVIMLVGLKFVTDWLILG